MCIDEPSIHNCCRVPNTAIYTCWAWVSTTLAHCRRCSVIFWFTDSVASCASKSRPWYKAAALAGDPDAQYNLGRGLDRQGTDPKRAQALLRAAAEQGSFIAQNDLAAMLLAGRGCVDGAPDLSGAEYWFAASASQGFYRAMLGLALLSERRGDSTKALQWTVLAAEQGADPEVMYRLGQAYLCGTGLPQKDLNKAMLWLKAAADLGHPSAQYAIGSLMICQSIQQKSDSRDNTTRIPMEADLIAEVVRKGEVWLLKSSQQGIHKARLELAIIYASRMEGLRLWQLIVGCLRSVQFTSSKMSAQSKLQLIGVLGIVPASFFIVLIGLSS